tara:strand:+ start:179 stop:1522 length:1344 start_codon:yes stop_codon:yes gene_type:complete
MTEQQPNEITPFTVQDTTERDLAFYKKAYEKYQEKSTKYIYSSKQSQKLMSQKLQAIERNIKSIEMKTSSVKEMEVNNLKLAIFREFPPSERDETYADNLRTRNLYIFYHTLKNGVSSDVADLLTQDQKRILEQSFQELPKIKSRDEYLNDQTGTKLWRQHISEIHAKYIEHQQLIFATEKERRAKIKEYGLHVLPGLVHEVIEAEAHQYEKLRKQAYQEDKDVETLQNLQKKYLKGKKILQKLASGTDIATLDKDLTDLEKANWQIICRTYQNLRQNVQYQLKGLEREVLLEKKNKDSAQTEIAGIFKKLIEEWEKRFKTNWTLAWRQPKQNANSSLPQFKGKVAPFVGENETVKAKLEEDDNHTQNGFVFDNLQLLSKEQENRINCVFMNNPKSPQTQYLVFLKQNYTFAKWVKQINIIVKKVTFARSIPKLGNTVQEETRREQM